MSERVVGVIGGSGLYDMEGLTSIEERSLDTPYGEPSCAFITGVLDGVKMVFLPRHGRGHRLLPSEINYRANIYGLKLLGVEQIISVSAVGSMKEEIEPGHMVVVDQFIDRTRSRESTFLGDGVVGHIEFADPVCPSLSAVVYDASVKSGATVHRGGTYICIEGPQFSTRAESKLYRSWGVSVIGMTNIPEARLAREAEICYSTLATSTDYDCWNESEESVTVEMILETISSNASMSKAIIKETVGRIGTERECGCGSAMANAVVTDRSIIPEKAKKNLIIGKYL